MTQESMGHVVYREDGAVWDERRAWDFVAEEGASALAAAEGSVVEVVLFRGAPWRGEVPPPPEVMDADGTNGNYVVIEHAHGERSLYCHLQDGTMAVTRGQKVKTGACIGAVGNTGWSLGPHLHFAVYRAWPDGTEGYETLEVAWAGPTSV
jgi:murein DD-endopeptidase MepM/ murein hydrolase activator NlpD